MQFISRSIVGSLLVLALFAPLSVRAQTNEGILAGTTVDPSGGIVSGAQVVAKNEATGATQTSTTGTDGAFRFPSLQVGAYDVTVSHPGFKSTTQTGLNVSISSITTVRVALSLGEAQQSVTVSGSTTSIQTESSEIGGTVTTKQIVELPLALGGVGALRSPEAFVFLQPGTVGPGTANSPNGIFISKIGGGQSFGNEVLLDGASTLRSENGSSFDEIAPSVEAIQEFKVSTATLPAEYGRTTGGFETFTTKSGTNTFHGTAYDILQNDDLDANLWFNNGHLARCAARLDNCGANYQQTYARPINKKNDYGGNFGGPVWIPKIYDGRNKTFFFFNWEQFRQNFGGTTTSIMPTAAERSGDFSSILTNTSVGTNPCDGSTIYQGQIFDPATTRTAANGQLCRTAFPGNRIPASRISPLSSAFLNYYPLPNLSQSPTQINYALSSSYPLTNTTYTVRIDHSFSDSSRIFASYNTRENARYTGNQIFPNPIVDSGGDNQDFITHLGRVGWDYILSPTLLNHLNIGFNRTNSLNHSTASLQALAGNFTWNNKLDLPQLPPGVNFPLINVGENIPGLGRGEDGDNVDSGWRFNDDVSWTIGKHSLTIGADVRTQLFAVIGYNDSGTYNFGRAQTAADVITNANSGNGFASFLLGDVGNGGRYIQGHSPLWNYQYYAGFVQDDFKVTPHLTLNLGIRWSLDQPRKESHNDTSNFDPLLPNPGASGYPGGMVFGNNCNGCNPRWANTYWKDFAPRFGFAWSPQTFHDRIVIRGGYGIEYGPLQYTDFGGGNTQGYNATPNFYNPNNLSPGFNWTNGFPATTQPPILNPTILNGQTGANYMAPSFGQPAQIQSWSFQVQGQVSKDTVATLGYVASRAQHLRSAIQNVNNMPLSGFALGDVLNQSVVGNAAGVPIPYAGFTGNVQQALRPFPQQGYIVTDNLQNIGQSSYESLQASLERRYSSGLTLQASFTWSKDITDADSIIQGDNGGIQQVQNPDGLLLDKALSSQDIPYMFVAAPLYELPFGKGKPFLTHGVGAAILGGWQLGAVLRYQTGTPISFGCASGVPGWDNCIRFNRVGDVSPFSPQVLNGNFDPFVDRYYSPVCATTTSTGCAFADPNTQLIGNTNQTVRAARGGPYGGAYSFGNYPRNNGDARSPNYYNEDISIIRNFTIKERLTFQIKGEMLNAFNRHIFSIPDSVPYDQGFGVVNNTIDPPRTVQFTARLYF